MLTARAAQFNRSLRNTDRQCVAMETKLRQTVSTSTLNTHTQDDVLETQHTDKMGPVLETELVEPKGDTVRHDVVLETDDANIQNVAMETDNADAQSVLPWKQNPSRTKTSNG